MKERAVDTSGLKIGEVTERTGLSVPTLRHYDHLGLVTPSGRTPGGFRLYSEDDVRRILLVRRMKPLGFTLEQMRDFLTAADIIATTGTHPDDEGAQVQREHARATLAAIRDEARARYEKLKKQVSYAEEFLGLTTTLEP